MKGIIIANKKSQNLLPLTESTSKFLLPVYDKPMIYYPLSVLMLAGIREVLFVVNEEHKNSFVNLLGDGNQWAMEFSYMTRPESDSEFEILAASEEYINHHSICLINGDTILYGSKLFNDVLKDIRNIDNSALIFAYGMSEGHSYDMVKIDNDDHPIALQKKKQMPQSNFAIPGIYFFDRTIWDKIDHLVKHNSNTIEIINLLEIYLQDNQLKVFRFGRGFAWLDADTHKTLVSAQNFIRTIEYRQGLMIACPEEIAFNNKWIDKSDLQGIVEKMSNNEYSEYLSRFLQ